MREPTLRGLFALLLAVSSSVCSGNASNPSPTGPTSNSEVSSMLFEDASNLGQGALPFAETTETTIGGRVTSSAGSPISGATVEVIRPPIDAAVRGTTDPSGVYRLIGIRSVTFTVRFSHPHYETFEFEFTFRLGTERLDLVNRLIQRAPTSASTEVAIYTNTQYRELALIQPRDGRKGIYLGTKDAEGLPLTISDAVIDGAGGNPDLRAWIKVEPDGKPQSGVLGSGDRITFEWAGTEGLVKVVRPDGTTVQAPLKRGSASSAIYARRAGNRSSGVTPLAITAASACRALEKVFTPTCSAEAELISTGIGIVADEQAVQAIASGQVVAGLAWTNLVIWNHAYGQACELAASYVYRECAARLTVVTAVPPPTPIPGPAPTTPSPSPSPRPGTPWTQLPPLSDAAKNFIVSYNVSAYGAVTRWDRFPISIWADPGFRAQDLRDAVNLWQNATGGRIMFSIVSAASSAQIVFTFDPSINQIAGRCGEEGPTSIQNNVISAGSGRYATKPECAPNGEWKIGLAHGIGHVLGLDGHTGSRSDVMGNPESIWSMSPLLSEIIDWLYSVPPGTKPQ